MSTEEPKHHRVHSSLDDFTLMELDFTPVKNRERSESISLQIVEDNEAPLPKDSLVIITETEKLEEHKEGSSHRLVASLSDYDFLASKIHVEQWDGHKGYSDYIQEGLDWLKKEKPDAPAVKGGNGQTIMLYESPSSSSTETSFHNRTKYRFHDWPPPKSSKGKAVLGPCRYSLMSGNALPVFLAAGELPAGLAEHWQKTVPNVHIPNFVTKVTEEDTVYAYLPVEAIKRHVNDPDVHFHLAGKDAIVLMTQKTTTLLPDTRTVRPCVVKTTHSMGSKGIFIIKNDEDEAEFAKFLEESGNPAFVVTDFVDIQRNVACHFYMHPNGKDVVWFGSNENKRNPDGSFSTDSYLYMDEQEKLKRMQLPFVEEVVQYCHSLGFWGFCGIDVLFDSQNRGYLVDINPRVTGSSPALMALQTLSKTYGFRIGLFRRGGDINFYGTTEQLIKEVEEYNEANEGKSRIVLHSMYQHSDNKVRLNIGVYGNDMDECKKMLYKYALPAKEEES